MIIENRSAEEKKTCGFELELHALMSFPNGFDPEKESLPMIVFLHGAGERGSNLDMLKVYGIPKLFSINNEYDGMRVITMAPQCPANMIWADFEPQLFKFIEETAKKYNADSDRISLTGVSMGGFATWSFACSHSEFFSAVAPVCGGGMEWRIGEIKIKRPILAYHGDQDPIVYFQSSKDMVDAYNRAGGNAKLVTCFGWEHNSWIPAYEHSTDLVRFLYNSHR